MTTRPAIINFNLYAGATFSEEVTLKGVDGEPLDLTGYKARMHIRREIDDPSPVFDLTSEGTSPAIVLGGAAGTVKFTIHPELMSEVSIDWLGETWVHDLLLTNANEQPPIVDRMFQGRIIAAPGVTRP